MNVLLINPNRFQNPPVIPIGLEYLLTYLRDAGHIVKVLDLCFSNDPIEDIQKTLENHQFDLIGVTIRNIDSAIRYDNQFFLDEIKDLIKVLKNNGAPIVLGGSGFTAMPDEILSFLGADFGIKGPGEFALLKLLDDLQDGKSIPKIISGWQSVPKQALVHLRGTDFDYARYIGKDGIVGIEIQKGCPHECSYCVEAGTGHFPKEIALVIKEIEHLIGQGYNRFHTCDSEFNIDLDYSINFCKELVKRDFNMTWALYMKPTPISEELFRLLKMSKVSLITCSVDSYEPEQKMSGYDYSDLEFFIKCCREQGIKLALDLLVGFPNEPKSSVERMINFLKTHRPDSVGVNFNFRLYKNTKIGQQILNSPDLRNSLSREWKQDENLLEPIFFAQFDLEYIKDLIKDDDLFKIEGIQKGVNYQRV
ncbi:MAG: B12-binding domain-containing radical SAM protein [Candidatus Helarchaeota archaeon]